MPIKKLSAILLSGLSFILLITGCQSKPETDSIGESPVPMQVVTQNSKEDYVTFEFSLPSDWLTGPKYEFSIIAVSKAAEGKEFEFDEDTLPYIAGISNYYYSGGGMPSEEDKQMYKALFAGDSNAYENKMNQSFANGASMLSSKFTSVAESPKVDYQYRHYTGINGRITEVQYSYTYNGNKTHVIQCFREDIPYSVTAAFSDSLDVSSGDIAPWVASSLDVTEHFVIKDNMIQYED